uniref:Uncharacterized protein n=1 Tax=Plectus sambesii TaxID=2011161 RepID=A0A914X1A0_9BILA
MEARTSDSQGDRPPPQRPKVVDKEERRGSRRRVKTGGRSDGSNGNVVGDCVTSCASGDFYGRRRQRARRRRRRRPPTRTKQRDLAHSATHPDGADAPTQRTSCRQARRAPVWRAFENPPEQPAFRDTHTHAHSVPRDNGRRRSKSKVREILAREFAREARRQ